MRAWPSALVNQLKSDAPGGIAQALYIKRVNDVVLPDSPSVPPVYIALTTADVVAQVPNVPIGGTVEANVTFNPLPHGVSFSSWIRSAGTDVDNAEASVFDSEETPILTLPEVLDRRWHASPWVVGLYSSDHPEYGFGPISCGFVGKIKQRVGKFIVELRDLRQKLNGNPTILTQAGCNWILGSNSDQEGYCRFNLTPVTVVDQVVTAVASQREFTCSARAGDPADRFGNGWITWATGINAGRRVRVVAFTAGVFTLDEDMVQGITVGDEFDAVWGCRGRFQEDCVDKFSAVTPLHFHNFGGDPHAPGPDKALNPKGQDT